MTINISLQILIYFFPTSFQRYADNFIHPGYLKLIKLNTLRSRVYIDAYDEIFIPILIYFILINRQKFNNSIGLLAVSFFSFISNFRTRFLMLLFAMITSVWLIFKKNSKKALFYFLVFFLLIGFLNQITNLTVKVNVINRLVDQTDEENLKTTTGRFKRWRKALEVGLSAPLIGVGLGNYYEYLDSYIKNEFLTSLRAKDNFDLIALQDPHNIFFSIFAESGFFGLFTFFLLIGYFVREDLPIILFNYKDRFLPFLIISYWTLMLFAFFNPTSTIKFYSLFWSLRLLIEKSRLSRSIFLSYP